MSRIARFSVSLPADLLSQFDARWKAEGYPTRSEAIQAMIHHALAQQAWTSGGTVAGAIGIVYDHHAKALANRLVDIQHDFGDVVVATQHAHMDHDNCLESLLVRGPAEKVQRLVQALKSVKGLQSLSVTILQGKENP
jgi:CopG family nickel-responsive transcriptional regulator